MKLNMRIAILKVAAFTLLIGPGVMMVTGPISPLMGLVDVFIDLAHQPVDGGQKVADDAGRLLNAILGGVLIGFGVMIWLVAERVYRGDETLGRTLILIPLLSWCVTDGLGSILAGAWFNAVLNLAILAAFLAPLLWPLDAAKRAPASHRVCAERCRTF